MAHGACFGLVVGFHPPSASPLGSRCFGVSVDGQRRVGRPEGLLGELVAAFYEQYIVMDTAGFLAACHVTWPYFDMTTKA